MTSYVRRRLLVAILSTYVVGVRAQASAPVAEVKVSTYQYGRFTVTQYGQWQTICTATTEENCYVVSRQEIEGKFLPPQFMPQEPSERLSRTGRSPQHVIFINYVTKELQYYRRDEVGAYQPVVGYPVVTPEAGYLPRDEVRGTVIQIVKNPTWCPKPGGTVRRDNPDLPPGCFLPGDPRNAMGGYRFDVAWSVPGWQLIKLHGSDGYPPGFEQVDTHGCTRLNNPELEALVDSLGSMAVVEGIEIVLHRKTRSLRELSM